MNNKGAYQIVKMQGFRFSGWQQKKKKKKKLYSIQTQNTESNTIILSQSERQRRRSDGTDAWLHQVRL